MIDNRSTPIIATLFMSIILFASSTFLLLGSANAQTVTAEIETATQDVIRDQINAFQSKEYERAFSHAAPTIKQIFGTTERFIGMVKGGYSPLYNPDSYLFGRNFNLDGTIHQEVIATDQNGRQWQAIYTLKQQPDGSWKITGVKMEPYKGAAT
ncbi:MAG: DUF4864 domain-containing protein [Pseudomonadota bacterium]